MKNKADGSCRKIGLINIILLLAMFFLTSCFYRELQIKHTVDGCDESIVFCTVDWVYEQNGDIPYHKSFIISIKKNDEYGIYLPTSLERKTSANNVSLVDEHNEKVYLFVTIKSESQEISVDDEKILFDPSDYPDFFVEIPVPQIPSYEIEFKFKKIDGTIYFFSFKMNQTRVKKWHFFPLLEIFAGG